MGVYAELASPIQRKIKELKTTIKILEKYPLPPQLQKKLGVQTAGKLGDELYGRMIQLENLFEVVCDYIQHKNGFRHRHARFDHR